MLPSPSLKGLCHAKPSARLAECPPFAAVIFENVAECVSLLLAKCDRTSNFQISLLTAFLRVERCNQSDLKPVYFAVLRSNDVIINSDVIKYMLDILVKFSGYTCINKNIVTH